jgi:phosphatidylglycerophosphate synthase
MPFINTQSRQFTSKNINGNINIPNLITLSRIIATPYIGYTIATQQYTLGLTLLTFAALSDALDGYIARKYNMQTPLGTILDPLADKLLMTTLVISLANNNSLPPALGVLIISRDVLLVLNTLCIRYQTLPEPVLIFNLENYEEVLGFESWDKRGVAIDAVEI